MRRGIVIGCGLNEQRCPEVGKTGVPVSINEDVACVEVAVHDPFVVQIFQTDSTLVQLKGQNNVADE